MDFVKDCLKMIYLLEERPTIYFRIMIGSNAILQILAPFSSAQKIKYPLLRITQVLIALFRNTDYHIHPSSISSTQQ